VFLTAVDYSFARYIWSHVAPSSCTASNPLIQSLATYYEWRMEGSPLLKYWDLLVAILLPLIFFTIIKSNVATVRGHRAPLGRHLLDAESLVQLIAVVLIVGTKAAPLQERFIHAVRHSSSPDKPDASIFADLTQLYSYHFLIFALNALQWFVPLLRVVMQQKQDTMKARDAIALESKLEREKRAVERANARAVKASMPSEKEMAERMSQAEAVATGKAVVPAEEQPEDGEITRSGSSKKDVRKRK
jgi:hypothetical protein